MNNSIRTRCARALGRHLVRVMPLSRAEWALAMKAEIEAIGDPGAALSFALGCARVGYRRRLRTVSGALAVTRWSVGTVTVFFSLLVLANAWWSLVSGIPGALPQIFGGLGVAFLIAGLALVRFGPVPVVGIAAFMLALNTAVLLAIGADTLPFVEVYRALVIEGYGLWLALLLVGLGLHQAARSPRLVELARQNGWEA